MPLIVDKAERRAMVARLAFGLVADRGIGAVTFRQVAEAAGTSTAIVTNYFHDKNDLLFEVYRIANREAMARLEAAFAAGEELVDCLAQVLPVTTEGQRNWRVWLAFWGLAHSEPAFRDETAANARASVDLYARMLARRYGGVPAPALLDHLARRLVATVGGVGLQACFDLGDWPLERLRAIIADEIAALDIVIAG
ncbi:MAG: TetR/AcrR family transcriptional regulator [Sphingomonadales bacterium]|nr:TetR/AcrR family transcriptional regulator [Sphingomonadales bacterium]